MLITKKASSLFSSSSTADDDKSISARSRSRSRPRNCLQKRRGPSWAKETDESTSVDPRKASQLQTDVGSDRRDISGDSELTDLGSNPLSPRMKSRQGFWDGMKNIYNHRPSTSKSTTSPPLVGVGILSADGNLIANGNEKLSYSENSASMDINETLAEHFAALSTTSLPATPQPSPQSCTSPQLPSSSPSYISPPTGFVFPSSSQISLMSSHASNTAFTPPRPGSSRIDSGLDLWSRPSTAPEMDRQLKKKHDIINEMLEAERRFLCDMTLVLEVYMTSHMGKSLSEVESDILFGNTPEVVEFTHSFYNSLVKNAFLNESTTCIGDAFLQHMNRMEEVYGRYLGNYNEATELLTAIAKRKKVAVWLEYCKECCGQRTNAWNLESLIVKPMQHLLKYPLLLEQLLHTTPEDGSDRESLAAALNAIKNVSDRLNQQANMKYHLDRRLGKRLPSKPKSKTTFFNKLSTSGLKPQPLSRPSTARPSTSRTSSSRPNTSPGGTNVNDEYDILTKKLRDSSIHLQRIKRDTEAHAHTVRGQVKQLEAFVGMMDATFGASIPSAKESNADKSWQTLRTIVQDLKEQNVPQHIAALNMIVLKPTKKLLIEFDRPRRLMQELEAHKTEYLRSKAGKDKGDRLDRKTREVIEDLDISRASLLKEIPRLLKHARGTISSRLSEFEANQTSNNWKRHRENIIILLRHADKISDCVMTGRPITHALTEAINSIPFAVHSRQSTSSSSNSQSATDSFFTDPRRLSNYSYNTTPPLSDQECPPPSRPPPLPSSEFAFGL